MADVCHWASLHSVGTEPRVLCMSGMYFTNSAESPDLLPLKKVGVGGAEQKHPFGQVENSLASDRSHLTEPKVLQTLMVLIKSGMNLLPPFHGIKFLKNVYCSKL